MQYGRGDNLGDRPANHGDKKRDRAWASIEQLRFLFDFQLFRECWGVGTPARAHFGASGLPLPLWCPFPLFSPPLSNLLGANKLSVKQAKQST